MTIKQIPTALLAAATVLSLSVGTALAQTGENPSAAGGYAFPDYWAQDAGPQPGPFAVSQQTDPASIGLYGTRHQGAGTWLFPPNPWQ